MVAVPVCPAAGAIVSVRVAPLPPTTRLPAGTSVALELAAVTDSEPAAVSTSPTVTVSGPTI